jgi:hypothetical protein
MRNSVDGHAALHTDAHAAECGARLAVHGIPAGLAGHHYRGGYTCALAYEHVPAVDGDGNLPILQLRFPLEAPQSRKILRKEGKAV